MYAASQDNHTHDAYLTMSRFPAVVKHQCLYYYYYLYDMMVEFCEWTVTSPDLQASLLILFYADLLINMKSGSLRVSALGWMDE